MHQGQQAGAGAGFMDTAVSSVARVVSRASATTASNSGEDDSVDSLSALQRLAIAHRPSRPELVREEECDVDAGQPIWPAAALCRPTDLRKAKLRNGVLRQPLALPATVGEESASHTDDTDSALDSDTMGALGKLATRTGRVVAQEVEELLRRRALGDLKYARMQRLIQRGRDEQREAEATRAAAATRPILTPPITVASRLHLASGSSAVVGHPATSREPRVPEGRT